jgi:hypothetical protein
LDTIADRAAVAASTRDAELRGKRDMFNRMVSEFTKTIVVRDLRDQKLVDVAWTEATKKQSLYDFLGAIRDKAHQLEHARTSKHSNFSGQAAANRNGNRRGRVNAVEDEQNADDDEEAEEPKQPL